MVFQERDEHSGRRDAGVVERVRKIGLAVFTLDADAESSRLGVAEVRAGADLEIFLLAGAPRLNVAGLDLEVGKITRAALELPDGNLQIAEQLHRVFPELIIPVHRLFGLADDDHFLLFKLVDAVHAAFFQTVAADFFAEAGRIRRERQRQLRFGQHLIDEPTDHRMLGRADQVKVLALDLVHHRFHLREGHDALDDVAVHHERRNDVGKALLVDHKVARVGKHRLVQPRDIAEQIVKAHAGDSSRGFLVDAVKRRHDIHMVGNFKRRHNGISEALDLDVAAVVGSNRDGRVNDVRNHIHDLADARVHLRNRLVELCPAVVVCLDGSVVAVDLRLQLRLFRLVVTLFELPVKRTVRLRELVARSLEALHLGNRGAALGIEVYHLVDQRQLRVLELLANVFLDGFGIFPQKSDVNHTVSLLLLLLQLFKFRQRVFG